MFPATLREFVLGLAYASFNLAWKRLAARYPLPPPYGSLAVCGDVASLTAMNNSTLLSLLRNTTLDSMRALFGTRNFTASSPRYGKFYFSISETFPIVIGLLEKPTRPFNSSVTELIASDGFIAYTDDE
ncbi:hypothetical protein OQA88_12447 [Cercophora sp. LCS_1]